MGNRGYGRLWYVGYGGYCWSSSTANTSNVLFLDFNSDGLTPQNLINPAYGFPLRCLQEEGFLCPAGRHPACFRGHSVKPSSPNPLGENITLSSPPLEPRGLLLSVMRQKVGKERSQGGYHPLGHPPLLPELGRNNSSKTPCGRGGFYPRARPGPTLSRRINLFPLPRSSRGGSYFLLCGRK